MSTYVMLTRLAPASLKQPSELESLEQAVMERIRNECPNVNWKESFSVLGPYDYVDLFDAPDNEAAVKVSTIVRTFGHAHTEIWPATEWKRFKELVRDLPGGR